MANPFAKPKAQPSESQLKTEILAAIADEAQVNQVLDQKLPPQTVELGADTEDRITGYAKLSKLVDEDFPFDESQLAAINGLAEVQYGCLTGAAGTGKTTSTKKLVDSLMHTASLSAVNMEDYWASGVDDAEGEDYEAPETWVPSILMCSFTGRAAQMIKKNFPRDWHGNIMTIHRALGFKPEFYDDIDEETMQLKKKMRFVPSYTSECQMPWDIIIIDEAGMLGIDLWHMLFAAIKRGARIYMIGDINQLPPVHGKPIFGYALAKWPSWELTHVHRQQGLNNPIVDNAWRILNGKLPVTEGRFQMIELKGDAVMASRKVRAMVPAIQAKGIFDPIRDTIITPINGEEGSRGFALGQLPLNREFAMIFNREGERFIIDGGRERKQFAVGDKVMATKNDWENGVTNGMTGVIVDIQANGAYGGDHRAFGRVEDVNKYIAETGENDEHVDFSLEDLESDFEAIDKGKEAGKEKKDRGPSSHIVTVRFGDEEHGFEIPFATLSEVGSLMTAYVVTCHKMQGGESPVIIIICHDSHKHMLYREWLYTAVTRASEKCILLYTNTALRTALNKQNIKGSTLKEKVASFNQAIDPKGLMGGAIGVNLPINREDLLRFEDQTVMQRQAVAIGNPNSNLMTDAEKNGGLMQLMQKAKQKESQRSITQEVAKESKPTEVKVTVEVKHTHTYESKPTPKPAPEVTPQTTVDGGDLTPDQKFREGVETKALEIGKLMPALTHRKPTHTQEQLIELNRFYQSVWGTEVLRLTHQPQAETPVVKVKLANPWLNKLRSK